MEDEERFYENFYSPPVWAMYVVLLAIAGGVGFCWWLAA